MLVTVYKLQPTNISLLIPQMHIYKPDKNLQLQGLCLRTLTRSVWILILLKWYIQYVFGFLFSSFHLAKLTPQQVNDKGFFFMDRNTDFYSLFFFFKEDLRVVYLPNAQNKYLNISEGNLNQFASHNQILYYKLNAALRHRSWSLFPFMLVYFSLHPFSSMDVSLMAEGNTSKMNQLNKLPSST